MKKGFTLNELLIALAIIGIIVIIAVPRVVSNMDKKSRVVALQSNYTAIANSVKMLMLTERAKKVSLTSLYDNSQDGNLADSAGAFLKKYFRVTKDCGTEPGECFAESYTNLNKTEVIIPQENQAYCVSISTGASICVTPMSPDVNWAVVVLDINGPTKPNISGRDLFEFYIYSDGFVGDRASGDGSDPTICKSNSYASGCFNRIINSGWVMDY